ncbi:MAG TPA: extracellular solute-binding protein [Gaiellaceae bacterium]|jgi:iron(III) transport system substrate-binding protein|nr:extracellular solute-binding protein [Gaiellaceae bacterium]
MHKSHLRFLVLVPAVFLLAAWGGSSSDSAPTLTLYSGQHQQTTEALVAGFEQATGIDVTARYDDEDVLANQIVAEGSHERADVIFTENTPALQYLGERGDLANVEASTLAHVPARFDSPSGKWVGVSGRVSVLIYNPKLISKKDLPTSVLAMASPRYKDKIALAAGETDFQPVVTSVLRSYGEQKALAWLNGLKSNAGHHLYADNETVAIAVNRGSVAFGIVNQYYWYRMADEIGKSNVHSTIALFAPHDPGYVIDVSGAGILSAGKHQAEAQKFVAFLVSRKGQQIIGHSTSFEYPIGSGVTTSEPEAPFAKLQPSSITLAQLGDGSTAIKLLQQVGLL